MPLTPFCHVSLPNAGLGNKLLVWAKGYVFSRLNSLPLVVTGWHQLQKGPLLKGGDLRLYWNYFASTDEVGWRTRMQARGRARVVTDPPIRRLEAQPYATIYRFCSMPPWSDYFGEFRDHRELVRDGLTRLLSPARMSEVAAAKPAVISMHVRLGDFQKLRPHEDFARVGNVRTPIDYFRRMIYEIRDAAGVELPVEILTDGKRAELSELLGLPNVRIAPRRTAIADIIVMSRSRILVTSAGSTFSYWAGFLGDCALILHPDHIHSPIRPSGANRIFYEGPLTGYAAHWPQRFLSNIQSTVNTPYSLTAWQEWQLTQK